MVIVLTKNHNYPLMLLRTLIWLIVDQGKTFTRRGINLLHELSGPRSDLIAVKLLVLTCVYMFVFQWV